MGYIHGFESMDCTSISEHLGSQDVITNLLCTKKNAAASEIVHSHCVLVTKLPTGHSKNFKGQTYVRTCARPHASPYIHT